MQNYKQYDSRWAGYHYAGENMAAAGCGPTSVANIVDKLPTTVADYITSVGGASNGSGTIWHYIDVALDHYGYNGRQLNSGSLYGSNGSVAEVEWKRAMNTGQYYGILLMGPGVFTKGGHYITIVKTDGSRYYVHDPASAARDGWHPWSDFAGCVKVFYLASKGSSGGGNTDSSSDFKATGTATCSDDKVNVRATAGGSVIGQLYKGNRFEVDGKTSGEWVHINVAGIGAGYMHQDYVIYDKTTTEVSNSKLIASGQLHANNFAGCKIATDGVRGDETRKAAAKVLQHAMNLDYNAKLDVDGLFRSVSKRTLMGHYVRKGESQYMVTAAEILLLLKGYDPNGVESPGVFGDGLEKTVKQYQKDHKLDVDGVVGYNTFIDLIA